MPKYSLVNNLYQYENEGLNRYVLQTSIVLQTTGHEKVLASLICGLLFFVAISLALQYYLSQKAFADGLTQENLPPASIGNRNAALFIKVNPPILTSASKQDAFMQFRLFDANNNNTIPWTTYHITVTKGIGQDGASLLDDFFQAQNGLLTLKIVPSNQALQIQGNQEPFLNAWVADPGGNIEVIGPIFLTGGLYHFRIEIFTVDNPRNIFIPSQAPKFDSWLSVGDVSDHNLQYNGQTYNITLISYYDTISNFNFDPSAKRISWTMPFDWNTTRLKSVQVFVHEEVRIPKSMTALAGTSSFNAITNGVILNGRMLAIDPYSFQNALTLHYLLNKNDIISMSEKVPSGTPNMVFSLSPNSNGTTQTSSDLTTDTGGIHVAVMWSPSQLSANTQSTMKVDFSDAFAGTSLNSDVKYDLILLDSNGMVAFSKIDLIAKGGSDTQTINLAKNGTYHIEIRIKELDRNGSAPDQTRNGVARGIVIVPEFPAGSYILSLVAGLFVAAVVASQRIVKSRNISP